MATAILSNTKVASFPGLLSPNVVEGLVKLLRIMTSGRRCNNHDATSRRFQTFLVHLSGGFLKSEVTTDCSVIERLSLIERLLWQWLSRRGLHFTRSATPPNVHPTSTHIYTQRLPDVILRRSFTRPSTALGDWRPGNEANTKVLVVAETGHTPFCNHSG